MLSQKTTPPHRIGHPTTADIIIATIKGIAPPHHPPDMPLSTLNNSAILDHAAAMPDLSGAPVPAIGATM